MQRRWPALVVVAAMTCMTPARAAQLTLDEENDAFASRTDHYYTQGLSLSYLTNPIAQTGIWDKPYEFLWDHFGVFNPDAPGTQRRIEWTILGQSLFTPTNLKLVDPNPADRPYAGWLYTGASFLQEHKTDRGTELENFEVLVGVVGPDALGRQTQNDFHTLIGDHTANGWGYQLANEPGVAISYERKWRYNSMAVGPLAVDVVPAAGVTVGNVFTYAQVGGMVRLGQNLETDYGPPQIRPGVSGTTWVDEAAAQGHVGWSFFLGAYGRAIARNIFLDGNTFTDSRSVPKKILVGDLAGGASVWVSRAVRLDLTVLDRSPEFTGQPVWDRYGTIALTFAFW